jgi:hypothetical protein
MGISMIYMVSRSIHLARQAALQVPAASLSKRSSSRLTTHFTAAVVEVCLKSSSNANPQDIKAIVEG